MDTNPRLSQLIIGNIPTYLPIHSSNRELNPLRIKLQTPQKKAKCAAFSALPTPAATSTTTSR